MITGSCGLCAKCFPCLHSLTLTESSSGREGEHPHVTVPEQLATCPRPHSFEEETGLEYRSLHGNHSVASRDEGGVVLAYPTGPDTFPLCPLHLHPSWVLRAMHR